MCLIASSILWTATGFLAVAGLALNEPRLMMLAILVANGAALSVGYLVLTATIRRERLRLEYLARIMATAAAESDVTRIHK